MKSTKNGFVAPLILSVIALLALSTGFYVYVNKDIVPPGLGEERITTPSQKITPEKIKSGDGQPTFKVESSSLTYVKPDQYHIHGSLVAEGVVRITASSSRVTLHAWDNRGDYDNALMLIQFKNEKAGYDDNQVVIGSIRRELKHDIKNVVFSVGGEFDLPEIISLNVGDSIAINIKATLDLGENPLEPGTYISGLAGINCNGTFCGLWDKDRNPSVRLGNRIILTKSQISAKFAGSNASVPQAKVVLKEPDSEADLVNKAPEGYAEAHQAVEVDTKPIITPSNSSGLTTYKSIVFNYSFEYPTNIGFKLTPYHKYTRIEKGYVMYREPKNDHLVSLAFNIGNVNDLGICRSYTELSKVGLDNGSTFKDITLNGHTFLKYTDRRTGSGDGGIGFTVNYSAIEKDVCYNFMTTSQMTTKTDDEFRRLFPIATPAEFSEGVNIIESMLSTLKY